MALDIYKKGYQLHITSASDSFYENERFLGNYGYQKACYNHWQ